MIFRIICRVRWDPSSNSYCKYCAEQCPEMVVACSMAAETGNISVKCMFYSPLSPPVTPGCVIRMKRKDMPKHEADVKFHLQLCFSKLRYSIHFWRWIAQVSTMVILAVSSRADLKNKRKDVCTYGTNRYTLWIYRPLLTLFWPRYRLTPCLSPCRLQISVRSYLFALLCLKNLFDSI